MSIFVIVAQMFLNLQAILTSRMQWFPWFLSSVIVAMASQQCKVSYSVLDHYLTGHVISNTITDDLEKCVKKCFSEPRCKSINFRFKDQLCELNDADRFTHFQDYGPREGHAYFHDSVEFGSCADVKEAVPDAKSGLYWITIRDDERIQVYCDMENFGGGWTLVVNISNNNHDHLQREANNCLNSSLCVPNPAVEESADGRKMKDEDIHELASNEGTFRLDVFKNPPFSVFYRIPSGASNFDSSCRSGSCPRIIISHSHPYVWEFNCKGIEKGYAITDHNDCHSVFDGHSKRDCDGKFWKSSQYDAGRRALYGYPCGDNFGIFFKLRGLLFVK